MTKTVRQLFLTCLLFFASFTLCAQLNSPALDTEVVAQGLEVPWEILWGPDDHIWITERPGRVSRLDPETGDITELLVIDEVITSSESGLLGMALDPDFTDPDHAFVYLVYTYNNNGLTEKLVRYSYDGEILVSPLILLDDIPAAQNHDGSRIIFTEDGKLLMTTGDAQNESLAQNLSSLAGKVLRINPDGSIPEDNPIPGSYIWTYGHRNPQGLVLAPDGTIFSSEHGPNNDDELNILLENRNYGWEDVHGYCDNTTESEYCEENNIMEPIAAWTPTLAVAGIDYYNHMAIPEWQHAILVTTLKEDELHVVKLNEAGDEVASDEVYFNNDFGRLRDLCISPQGDIYLATSNRDGRANDGFPVNMDDRIIRIFPETTDPSPLGLSASRGPAFYPNPAIDYIKFSEKEIRCVRIYDLSSKLLLEGDNLSTQLDISALSPGTYLIEVTTLQSASINKLIKK